MVYQSSGTVRGPTAFANTVLFQGLMGRIQAFREGGALEAWLTTC